MGYHSPIPAVTGSARTRPGVHLVGVVVPPWSLARGVSLRLRQAMVVISGVTPNPLDHTNTLRGMGITLWGLPRGTRGVRSLPHRSVSVVCSLTPPNVQPPRGPLRPVLGRFAGPSELLPLGQSPLLHPEVRPWPLGSSLQRPSVVAVTQFRFPTCSWVLLLGLVSPLPITIMLMMISRRRRIWM